MNNPKNVNIPSGDSTNEPSGLHQLKGVDLSVT